MSEKQLLAFGEAVLEMKDGKTVSRIGLPNGHIYIVKGSFDFDNDLGQEVVTKIAGVDAALFEYGAEGTVARMPRFDMNTRNATITGWQPTTIDILSEDWFVIEQE